MGSYGGWDLGTISQSRTSLSCRQDRFKVVETVSAAQVPRSIVAWVRIPPVSRHGPWAAKEGGAIADVGSIVPPVHVILRVGLARMYVRLPWDRHSHQATRGGPTTVCTVGAKLARREHRVSATVIAIPIFRPSTDLGAAVVGIVQGTFLQCRPRG